MGFLNLFNKKSDNGAKLSVTMPMKHQFLSNHMSVDSCVV